MPELLDASLQEESLVAEPITGTNTEEIDQLIGAVADLRIQIADLKGDLGVQIADLKGDLGAVKAVNRVLAGIFVLCFPSLILLNAFLIQTTLSSTAELKIISTRLQRIEEGMKEIDRELRDHNTRITRLEATVAKQP